MTRSALKRREFIVSAAAAMTIGALPASVRAAGASAPINFGFPNASWGTIGMIGEAIGAFSKAGANVKVFAFDSGKTTRDAMISGRIDIGVIGSTPFIIGAAKGQMEGVAVALYGAKTLALVASAKGHFNSVKDLRGHRIGSQVGSLTDFVLKNKILPKYGLSVDDVTIVNVSFQNQVAALAAGSIDAFAGAEPFVSVAEVEHLGHVLVDYSDFDLSPVMLAANKALLDTNQREVIAFLRGWLVSVKTFKNNPSLSEEIVLKHFQHQGFSVNKAIIARMLSKFDVRPTITPAVSRYFEAQSKLLLKRRKIAAIPDWSKVLNRSLLAAASAKS